MILSRFAKVKIKKSMHWRKMEKVHCFKINGGTMVDFPTFPGYLKQSILLYKENI